MLRKGQILHKAGRAALDAGLLFVAVLAAYALRFNFDIPERHLAALPSIVPATLALELASLALFGCYKTVWRWFSVPDVPRLLHALASVSVLQLALRVVFHGSRPGFYLPISVNLMNFALALCALSGVRWFKHMLDDRPQSRHSSAKLVAIAGTGSASLSVAYALRGEDSATRRIVGFIGETGASVGSTIRGYPVIASMDDGERGGALDGFSLDELIVPQGAVDRGGMKRLLEMARKTGARLQMAPGYSSLLDGVAGESALRRADITDILRRGVVSQEAFAPQRSFIEGRRVLVTGAGGSIGSEIARQVLAAGASRLIAVERGELALFEISRELAASPGAANVVRYIADAGDAGRMGRILAEERPEVVFHAAAYKHVPLMEENPCEAILNNVSGTVSLGRACMVAGVGTFVLLSSDKAVKPSSVMGATKRLCELALLSMESKSTRFTAVRFGNVLGSTGSVVSIFRDQILRGGPVTVTHPGMERYFMTIPEAASLTLVAAAMAGENPGRAFVLDMGEPVSIVNLAEDMIRLAGKVPGRDVQIVFTGVRPGEKLGEILAAENEPQAATAHPQISTIAVAGTRHPKLEETIKELEELSLCGDGTAAKERLMAFAGKESYL